MKNDFITGSKGRWPFEFSNFRVVDVIEQRNDSECSIFARVLPEVRVGAQLNTRTSELSTLLNNVTTRERSKIGRAHV